MTIKGRSQRDIHGFDFEDERAAAACSRWNLPPRGGFGRAAIFSFFRRSALWIGVSSADFGSFGIARSLWRPWLRLPYRVCRRLRLSELMGIHGPTPPKDLDHPRPAGRRRH